MEHHETITFASLRVHFRTGRSYVIRTDARNKTYGYRKGLMTDLGDLEEAEWSRLATALIRDTGEEELQENLCEWIQEHCPWIRTKEELKLTALEYHMDRLFDNVEWVDYIPFNQMYRPEKLKFEKGARTNEN